MHFWPNYADSCITKREDAEYGPAIAGEPFRVDVVFHGYAWSAATLQLTLILHLTLRLGTKVW